MLFDHIIERQNEFINYCNSYTNQNICIFGSGLGAYKVYGYLEKRGIPVYAVAVAKNYVAQAKARLQEIWGGGSSNSSF